jgi:hypothetical protein
MRFLIVPVSLAALSVLPLSACGRIARVDGAVDDVLPPTESFFLSLPADEGVADTDATQAVCADGTVAYDRLEERAHTYNEALQQQTELIRLAVSATQRQLERTGEAERSVTRNDRTLTMRAVQTEDGVISYEVTLTVAEGESQTLLTGMMAADRLSGSWNIEAVRADRSVTVAWTRNESGSEVQVDRIATGPFGERTASYTRNGDDVSLVFAGPEHTATAQWSRSTRDGSITIDGEQRCWDASEDGLEFCNITCPAE